MRRRRRTCRGYAADLQARLDGELAGPAVAEVEAHVDGCPDCRATVRALVAVRAAVRRLRRPTDPGQLTRVTERLQDAPR